MRVLPSCSMVGISTIKLTKFTKALRLVYKDETFLSFDDLLTRDKSVSIHQKIYKSLRQRPVRQNMI